MAPTADATEEPPGLFTDLKFFILQRVPSRTTFIQEIQNNGGEVVRHEQLADLIIADHRKDAPDGSVSWKFIDQAVKNGRLPNIDDHIIHTAAGPGSRPAGSTAVAPKKTRVEYTAEEDLALRRYVWNLTKDYRNNRGQGGNQIYMAYAKLHPQHSWQSYRDRYVKRLRPLGEPSQPGTHAPARSSPTSSYKYFTAEEDLALCNYVYSKPLDRRRGNKIYTAYAVAHPEHSAQSYRSRFIKLEDDNQVPADLDASVEKSPTRSDLSSASTRVPFTAEDDWTLWEFVQEHGGSEKGNQVYKDLFQLNERHSWGSWRHRYIKFLMHNPPRRAVGDPTSSEQPAERTGAQTASTQSLRPGEQQGMTKTNLVHRLVEDLSSRQMPSSSELLHRRAATTAPAPTGIAAARQGANTSAAPSEGGSEDVNLSQEQQALLAAILGRKPRDSKGSYYTALEISHLIWNMQDLVDKTSSATQSTMWHDWTAAMESRCAEDWKDLYDDHVYPEAVRLGQVNLQPSRSVSVQPQAAAPTNKRRATTLLQDETNKRARHNPDADDSSSDAFSPQKSTRSEQQQLHGSVIRRESIFEQAVHKRQAEESIRESTARATSGDRLTAANLAAQMRAQQSTQSSPAKPAQTMSVEREGVQQRDDSRASAAQSEDRHRETNNSTILRPTQLNAVETASQLFCTPAPDEGHARNVHSSYPELRSTASLDQSQPGHNLGMNTTAGSSLDTDAHHDAEPRLTRLNAVETASDLFCTPASGDGVAIREQVGYSELRSTSSLGNSQQQRARAGNTTTDSSLELYNSSVPPKPPPSLSEHEATQSLPVLQERPLQAFGMVTQPETQETDISGTQDTDIEIDLDVPSPPGSHISLPSEVLDEGRTENDEKISTDSLPHDYLEQSTHHTFDNDVLTSSIHKAGRRSSGSSSAFETLTQIDAPVAKYNTQAILEAETQELDLDLPDPGSDSVRSSPPAETVFSLADIPEPAEGATPEEAQEDGLDEVAIAAMLAPYYDDLGEDQVSTALIASSGRPHLAVAILNSLRRGQDFEPNANWRWSEKEDKILQGADARLMKALQDKHGAHEYNVRVQFLNDLIDSQE
ncbi:hypothetical protein AMS68_007848 [Peltaster fructicola]|uniref:Telomeric repeat-binding factor 2-interacting protein 1 n=1 Tax=Peltaster fructicola TaxID=286661 RepID=A0A6H0Y661_9PEZI|nr:hypothetical protein AMS68_007848 [Peltaster fructicola]